MIIDSHCHLLSMEYENVDEQVKMAIENGVTKMIINGYDLKSSMEAVSLANKYKEVYAAVGIGPENVEGVGDFELKKIKERDEKWASYKKMKHFIKSSGA